MCEIATIVEIGLVCEPKWETRLKFGESILKIYLQIQIFFKLPLFIQIALYCVDEFRPVLQEHRCVILT